MSDLEVGSVRAKVGADISEYTSAMEDGATLTKKLAEAIQGAIPWMEKERAAMEQAAGVGQATEHVLQQLGYTTEEYVGYLGRWTTAQQNAAMSMSATHDQALKMNAALEEGTSKGTDYTGQLVHLAAAGIGLGTGLQIAHEAMALLKAVTIENIEAFVEFAHGIDLVHTKIGVPLEYAAAWQQAAGVTGVSAERMANGIAMMDQRLETNNKQALAAVDALHLSVEQLRDASPEKQVELLADAFQRLEGTGVKADVVIKELMGRQGLAMLPALTKDAQDLEEQIRKINGPLEEQVATAHRYLLETALIGAEWDKIKRSVAEPIVGAAGSLIALYEEKGLAGIINAYAEGGAVGLGVAAATAGSGKARDINLPDYGQEITVRASQADIDKADAQGRAMMADYTRRAIEVEKEYEIAIEGTGKGLEFQIGKIKANTDAKIAQIEADTKLDTIQKGYLEAMQRLAGEAQIDAAEEAAAKKTASDATKEYAAAQADMAVASEKSTDALDAAIIAIQAKHDKEVAAIDKTLETAEAEGRLTQDLIAGAAAHYKAADAMQASSIAKAKVTDATKTQNAEERESLRLMQLELGALKELDRAHSSELGLLGDLGSAMKVYESATATSADKVVASWHLIQSAIGAAVTISKAQTGGSGIVSGAEAGSTFGVAGALFGAIIGGIVGAEHEAANYAAALMAAGAQARADQLANTIDGTTKAFSDLDALSKAFDATLERQGEATDADAEKFAHMGDYALATFATLVHATGDFWGALEKLGPTLDRMQDDMAAWGFKGSQAIMELIKIRDVVVANEDVADSIQSLTKLMQDLTEAGALTLQLFRDFAMDAKTEYDTLIGRGVDANDALKLMQPTLQQLWEAEHRFGYTVDDTTQSLIDQAYHAGIIGEQFESVYSKILDVLLDIEKVLYNIAGIPWPDPSNPSKTPPNLPPPGTDPNRGPQPGGQPPNTTPDPGGRPPGYPPNLPWPPNQGHASAGGGLAIGSGGGSAGGIGTVIMPVSIGRDSIGTIVIDILKQEAYFQNGGLVSPTRRMVTGRP